MRRVGLKCRYVTVAKLTRHCFAERGQKRAGHASLVFVHGLAGSKDIWNPIVHVRTCPRYSFVNYYLYLLFVGVSNLQFLTINQSVTLLGAWLTPHLANGNERIDEYDHRRRSSVNFRGARHFCPKICMKN